MQVKVTNLYIHRGTSKKTLLLLLRQNFCCFTDHLKFAAATPAIVSITSTESFRKSKTCFKHQLARIGN